ncbi:MAG: ABC transporter ATP-binding protein [Treponema sp.]|nr:ABC transporter ATP-binding protein [Treponema sp.]
MSGQKSSIVENGFRPRGRGGMGRPVEKPKNGKKTVKRLFAYFRNETLFIVLLSVVVVVSVAVSVLAPTVQSRAIDGIVGGAFEKIPTLLVLMLSLYLVHAGTTLFQGFLSGKLSQHVVKKVRRDLFEKTVNLPVSYIDSHPHGDIMSRMTSDAENVSNVISQSLSSLFSGVLTLIGTVTVMMVYSVPLTLLTFSTVVLSVIATRIFSSLMHKYFLKKQTLLGQLNGIVTEKVTAVKTVAAYNLQQSTIEEFNRASSELTRTGIKADIIGNAMGPVMNMLNNCSFVIVAAFGAWFALRGMISVGVISAFIIYSKQFSRPINELAQLYGELETAVAGAERIFELLDCESEDKSGEKTLELTDGVIEFKDVNFSYVPGKPVIRNFSLKIGAGKKIALVGTTGSGKTTVVNLLMRFYPLDSGTITVDGTDIRNLTTDSLRDSVGIVLQDTVLFTDTVRRNLKYADQGISDEKMFEAASLSSCDKVVESLSDGYDTVLHGAGSNLSQGQRQLLTIGRAFLSYPRILILDEATSSVDTRTEKQIQDAMAVLMKDRTSLIIAHRLSTIQDADMIVVMDQGRIIETGNHRELLAKNGSYKSLYMSQFAGQET